MFWEQYALGTIDIVAGNVIEARQKSIVVEHSNGKVTFESNAIIAATGYTGPKDAIKKMFGVVDDQYIDDLAFYKTV